MKTHKDLEVWKLSISLAGDVYQLTEKFPGNEMFGITSQMRRAVVSIGANIAEGAARRSKKEFTHYLYIALGSASELDTLIEICRNIKLPGDLILNKLQENLTIISKMLNRLIYSLHSN